MHLLLVAFCIFTWMSILESEEKFIELFKGLGLIQSHDLVLSSGSVVLVWLHGRIVQKSLDLYLFSTTKIIVNI